VDSIAEEADEYEANDGGTDGSSSKSLEFVWECVGGDVVSGRVVSFGGEECREADGVPPSGPSGDMGDGEGRGLFDGGQKWDGLGVRWPEDRLVRTGRLSAP